MLTNSDTWPSGASTKKNLCKLFDHNKRVNNNKQHDAFSRNSDQIALINVHSSTELFASAEKAARIKTVLRQPPKMNQTKARL